MQSLKPDIDQMSAEVQTNYGTFNVHATYVPGISPLCFPNNDTLKMKTSILERQYNLSKLGWSFIMLHEVRDNTSHMLYVYSIQLPHMPLTINEAKECGAVFQHLQYPAVAFHHLLQLQHHGLCPPDQTFSMKVDQNVSILQSHDRCL